MFIGQFIQWLLGIDGDGIPFDAEVRLGWTNLPSSWRVFVALFVAAGLLHSALWIYRRDAARLTARQRQILTGLRLAAIALLLLAALGPSLAFTQYRILKPVVVVLRDSSLSMATADRYLPGKDAVALAQATGRIESSFNAQPPSRADIVNDLFRRQDGALLTQLGKRGQLRMLDFAESVTPVSVPAQDQKSQEPPKESDPSTPSAPESYIPLKPAGPGTNLHRALQEALSERLTAAEIGRAHV